MDELSLAYREPQRGETSDFESLVHMCEFRAKDDGDKTAFVFLRDGEVPSGQLSYAELVKRAKAIASQLPGDAHGERALLLYSSGLEFITAFIGCLYAGVLAVPVYTPQARQEHWDRLDIIANDAQARYIFTTAEIAQTNQEFIEKSEVLSQTHLVKTDEIETLTHEPWSFSPAERIANLESLAFFAIYLWFNRKP
jgi:acyl-CoA synthetase (AMP-forming)/AMP-acid ligase II